MSLIVRMLIGVTCLVHTANRWRSRDLHQYNVRDLQQCLAEYISLMNLSSVHWKPFKMDEHRQVVRLSKDRAKMRSPEVSTKAYIFFPTSSSVTSLSRSSSRGVLSFSLLLVSSWYLPCFTHHRAVSWNRKFSNDKDEEGFILGVAAGLRV